MRRICTMLALGALIVPAAQARPPLRLAPPVICTMHNRLDIFVDEDNILWACECEALKSGHICRWQVIGGVDAVSIRRKLRARYHAIPHLRPVTL